MTFDEAVSKARGILCGDTDGTFTCHTVDPFIDEIARAHDDEMRPLVLLRDRIKDITERACHDRIRTPWCAEGRCVYDGPSAGDPVATFEDVKSEQLCRQTVDAVNALEEVRKALSDIFPDVYGK